MGIFGITYRETYEKYYEIEGENLNTNEEAENELRMQIEEGILKGPEECVESSCQVERLDKAHKYLLIYASGEDIQVTDFYSFAEAQKAMRDAYQEASPLDFEEEFEDLSYIGDANAVLYYNGEDVYAWSIEKIEF